jgi:hypothetical protein
MKRRFHPFLLTEVFIAITLLALCLLPLMTFPYRAAQKEREALFSLEKERLLGVAFARLLQNKENFFSLTELLEEGALAFDLPEVTLDLPKHSKTYHPKLVLEVAKELEKEKGIKEAFIRATLTISDKEASYFFTAEMPNVK